MEVFYSREFAGSIEKAIQLAESKTSCEFKIHIEEFCNEDVYDRAAYVFSELKLHKTQRRNAVLIYLAYLSRKIVILADVGARKNLSETFIQNEINLLVEDFKQENYISGITDLLERLANSLIA
ncbi:MAG: TPM domain-containing protein [Bacteroidota bacterium]